MPNDADGLLMENSLYSTKIGGSDYKGAERTEIVNTLVTAVKEKNVVSVEYRSAGKDEVKSFDLDPMGLILHKRSIYLLAKRKDSDTPRCFKADRFNSVELSEEKADIPDGFSCEEFMHGSFGVFTPEDNEYEVKVRFSKAVSGTVLESVWHKTQEETVLADGEVELSFRLRGLAEVKTWILSWGPCAQVLAPMELVSMVQEDLRKCLQQYG
ncbi:MAG: WYL domain-containing protein [Fuerstiella sp.]|nr:WYL domain-containing protein [Fuerstiella sp.]MCP4856398.1 WYL domain-containing protein [Fuerstiella sp.]